MSYFEMKVITVLASHFLLRGGQIVHFRLCFAWRSTTWVPGTLLHLKSKPLRAAPRLAQRFLSHQADR
jgi:hypothetical protein